LNNELNEVWKEAVVAEFEVLSWHENNEEKCFRIFGVSVEVRTWRFRETI
jgi:hypothetical protein